MLVAIKTGSRQALRTALEVLGVQRVLGVGRKKLWKIWRGKSEGAVQGL